MITFSPNFRFPTRIPDGLREKKTTRVIRCPLWYRTFARSSRFFWVIWTVHLEMRYVSECTVRFVECSLAVNAGQLVTQLVKLWSRCCSVANDRSQPIRLRNEPSAPVGHRGALITQQTIAMSASRKYSTHQTVPNRHYVTRMASAIGFICPSMPIHFLFLDQWIITACKAGYLIFSKYF